MKENLKDLKDDFKDDTKEIKHDVRLLLVNQKALEAHDMAIVEKLVNGLRQA